jgi:hypothetical protein
MYQQPPRPVGRQRPAVIVWVLVPLAVVLMAAAGVAPLALGLRGPAYATRFPGMCGIYDTANGRGILAGIGASKGKRIPLSLDRDGQDWSLCAFGTDGFQPKHTFQIQIYLYPGSSARRGIDAAKKVFGTTGRNGFGCTTPLVLSGRTGWDQACEGGAPATGWAEVVGRRANVVATALVSSPNVTGAQRAVMRRAVGAALDRMPWRRDRKIG